MGCRVGNWFTTGVAAEQHVPALRWQMCVDQWPFSQKKLQQLHQLVQEELQSGHIVPTISPWNSPVFVIQKKSGTWWLLQDLKKKSIIFLCLWEFWTFIVIDLKDCFFFLLYHFVNTMALDLHFLCLPLSQVSTLSDLQKLLGTINRLCLLLDVTTEQLYPFFQLLKENPEPTSPCSLTPRATETLEQITQVLSVRQACRKVDGFLANFSLNLFESSYCSPIPIANACMVFTYGSGKTGRSVTVWQSNRQWL